MRVEVLNGVNLDQLGRRDPAVYGDLSLRELESRIYAWAKDLGLTVRCRQTNHEGEYVDWLHEALDTAGGVVLNPAAWTHYSWAIRDAVELLTQPVVEVHLSNVDEREEWRRLSVISDLAAKRIAGKGPDGYREALEFLAGSGMSERLARLQEAGRGAAARLEPRERALPDRPRELERSAARRARAAAACSRTSATPSAPAPSGESSSSRPAGTSTRSSRRSCRAASGSSRRRSRYERYAILEGGGLELVPRTASSRRCVSSRTTASWAPIRRAAAVTNEAFERLAEEPFVGRCGARARLADGVALPRAGRRGARRSRSSSRPGPRAARRTRCRATGVIERGGDDRRGRRLPDRRLLLGLHADVPRRASCPTSSARAYQVVQRGTAVGPRGGARRSRQRRRRPRWPAT